MTNLSLRGILDILDEYQVSLRKNSNTIEWKYNYEDNTAWRVLFVLDELRGAEVQLDANETHLIWKLNNQFEWLELVSIEDLVMLAETGYLDEIEERVEYFEDLESNLYKGYFKGQPVAGLNKKEELFQYLPMPNNEPAKSTAAILRTHLHVWPIDVKYPCVLSQLSVSVTTARASAVLNICLYDSHPTTGKPQNLLYISDTLNCATTGIKTCSKAVFLLPGRYWIGRRSSGGSADIAVRSYSSNVCDFLSSFSSLSVATGTATADQIYNSLIFSNTTILESLTDQTGVYGNTAKTLFGKISSLYDVMMGTVTYKGTTLAGPLFDIIKASDNMYFIVSGNKVYYSSNLTSFAELTVSGAVTTGFKTICEVSDNRIVIADQDTLFIKHRGYESIDYAGAWSAGTYAANKYVSHNNLLWVSLKSTTLEPTIANSADWRVYLRDAATFAGAWSAGTYQRKKTVIHNDILWTSLKETALEPTFENDEDWQYFYTNTATFESDWDVANVPYAANSIVVHSGELWISLRSNSEEPTELVTDDWASYSFDVATFQDAWDLLNAPYVADSIVYHNDKMFLSLVETSEEPLATSSDWLEFGDQYFIKQNHILDGAWGVANVPYAVNKIVTHNDKLFLSIAENSEEPLTTTSNWVEYGQYRFSKLEMPYLGAWSVANVPYATESLVINAGSLFMSRKETSEEPTSFTDDWVWFGERGFIKNSTFAVTNENAVGLYINGSSDSSKVFVTHADGSCQVTVFDLDDTLTVFNDTINPGATTNKPYSKPIKFATDSFVIASSTDTYGYSIVRCDGDSIETMVDETLIDTNIVLTKTNDYIYAFGRKSANEMFVLKIHDEGTLVSTEKVFDSVNASDITAVQAVNDNVFVFGGSNYYWTDNYFDNTYLLSSITETANGNAALLDNDVVIFVTNHATTTIWTTTKFERSEV
jgi:hypothetical protein